MNKPNTDHVTPGAAFEPSNTFEPSKTPAPAKPTVVTPKVPVPVSMLSEA